jgi:transposase
MANHLKMAVVDSIYTLREQGLSQRQIARLLRIDRETVRRHIRLVTAAGPPRAPTGDPGSNPATAPPGSASSPGAIQPSVCESFRAVILAMLDQGLTAQRIHQDLVAEHGFAAKYHSVRRFVQKLGRASPLPFRRMECEPGVEAQVDFGQGAPVVGVAAATKRKRPYVFRIVLSHSRKGYSEVVGREGTEEFIRALENAFWRFGGVPRTLVIDNLKAAVTKADWYDPELNPKLQAFCRHYGTAVLPTRPRTPRHKGKIEAGVKYVQSNALKGRTFPSLSEQNQFLLDWERTVADTRIHGTTCKQVGKVFEAVERPVLLPLPAMRFPSFQESRRTVNRDGHVEVAKAYYSVPPEYLSRPVWARWDGRLVWIFDDQMRPITEHIRVEAGRFSTHAQHIADRKISGVERGATWMLRKIGLIGPQSTRWAEAMLQVRGIEGVRVLQGLMSLTCRYKADGVERACAIAHGHGAYRLRDVRKLIDRQADQQQQFEFAQEHPIIRSLAEYGELVHSAFSKENP